MSYLVDNKVSLVRLTGSPVADILGHLTTEYGSPTFVPHSILFENGQVLYIPTDDIPHATNDYWIPISIMKEAYKEQENI